MTESNSSSLGLVFVSSPCLVRVHTFLQIHSYQVLSFTYFLLLVIYLVVGVNSSCFYYGNTVALLSVVSSQTFFNQNRRSRTRLGTFRRFQSDDEGLSPLNGDDRDTSSDSGALPCAGGVGSSYSSAQQQEGGDARDAAVDAGIYESLFDQSCVNNGLFDDGIKLNP